MTEKHGLHEDALALVLGSLMVALGTTIYTKAVLVVGGMAGVALLLQYTTGVQFWLGFSLINLPCSVGDDWAARSSRGRSLRSASFRSFRASRANG